MSFFTVLKEGIPKGCTPATKINIAFFFICLNTVGTELSTVYQPVYVELSSVSIWPSQIFAMAWKRLKSTEWFVWREGSSHSTVKMLLRGCVLLQVTCTIYLELLQNHRCKHSLVSHICKMWSSSTCISHTLLLVQFGPQTCTPKAILCCLHNH